MVRGAASPDSDTSGDGPLAVPVLAALAGVFVLSEAISLRLVISAVVILGGVGLAVSRPKILRNERRPFNRHDQNAKT